MKRNEKAQHFVKWLPLFQRKKKQMISGIGFGFTTSIFDGYDEFLVTKHSALSIGTIKIKVKEKEMKNSLFSKLSADIHVKVTATKVTLSGIVNSFYSKNEAEKMAWKEKGICKVENQLIIVYDNSLIDYVY